MGKCSLFQGGTPLRIATTTERTYDAAGNPQNWRNADDIEWLESAGKQMSLFFDSENGLYMYEYNMDNIRTKKTVYGEQGIDFLYESQYILNGTSIVRETRTYADGSVITLDFLYDDSGVILGVVYNGTEYYYRKNLQGDITGIVNSSGTVVVSYTYDAWGNLVSITGSMASTLGEINPIRYRGYYYDTETGFYYLQSRYYDPVVGRFISPDSTDFLGATGTTLSLNLFAYCENSPTNDKDINGYISANKIANMFSIAAIAALAMPLLYASYTKGLLAVGSYVTKIVTPIALKAFWWKPWAAATIIVSAVAIIVAAVGIHFSKQAKKSGKERANNPPSWVSSAMNAMPPHWGEKAKDYARRLMDSKYGSGNWKTGPDTEYNKIVKYLTRHVGMS